MLERFTGPPPQAFQETSDVAALEEIRHRLQDAENAFDPHPMVDALAEDAVLMVPNEPTQEGKTQVAEFVTHMLAHQQAWFDRRITYVSDEISVRGDLAFDRGTFSFSVVAKHDGQQNAATGKYFWLYSRAESGAWLLSRAILSLDDPPEDVGR